MHLKCASSESSGSQYTVPSKEGIVSTAREAVIASAAAATASPISAIEYEHVSCFLATTCGCQADATGSTERMMRTHTSRPSQESRSVPAFDQPPNVAEHPSVVDEDEALGLSEYGLGSRRIERETHTVQTEERATDSGRRGGHRLTDERVSNACIPIDRLSRQQTP